MSLLNQIKSLDKDDMYRKEVMKIIKFLTKNKWKLDCSDDEYIHFIKDFQIGVDIGENEIVIVDDTGDILHLNLDYYAFLGFFYSFRILNIRI